MPAFYLPAILVSSVLLAAAPDPGGTPADKTAANSTDDPRTNRRTPKKEKKKPLEPWEIEVLKNLRLLEQMELLEKLDLLDDWQILYEKGGR